MYGVLHPDGRVEELTDVDAASIQYEQLVCYDASDNVVAVFPANEVTFGDVEALKHIAGRLSRLEAYRRLERLTQQR